MDPETEKTVDELIDGYNKSENDGERESWLEAFMQDLSLIECVIKRLNAAKEKTNAAHA